jgi:hypothetical protein
MTNVFSAFSLKRNRSSSTCSNKKESKFNAILNKLTSPFQNSNNSSENKSSNKKRRQYSHNRRSSLSTFIDYFCATDDESFTSDNHPFANDALFEQNRYKQQKKRQSNSNQQQQKQCILPQLPSALSHNNNSTISILMKPATTKKPSMISHRHTNSSPSAFNGSGISTDRRRKKASHIRHYSHVSCISASNITVNSEDLTAKEFADIAGIRILSEDEDDDIAAMNAAVENQYSTNKKICSFCGDEDNDIMVPSLIVTTSRVSMRDSNNSSIIYPEEECEKEDEPPQIWDNQFWKKPGQQEEPFHQIKKIVERPPILHESTTKKYNSVKPKQEMFIKKGRFEIHLSVNNNSLPTKKLNSNMVDEWRRLKTKPTITLKHQVTA